MRLRPIRTRFLGCVAAILPAFAGTAHAAGPLDPLLRFRQIRTDHFTIYFHQGEEPLARRLASAVEGVRDDVGWALRTDPPSHTHVILADQSELANGWASPLPRDVVFLNAAAPSGADFIGRTDDWLRLVFTHEYTHIVHLDRSEGWARVARWFLGRTPVAFPNLWLPQWQIEGIATWEESALTGVGRLHAGDFRAIERVAATAGQPLRLDQSSGGLVGWPDGHAAYSAGLGFHEYLVNQFGEASLGDLAERTARRLPFFGTPAFRGVYGQSLGALWKDYSRQIAKTPIANATSLPMPRRLTRHGNIVTGPRFAPPMCSRCPVEIVYSVQNPHTFPSLRAVGVEGGDGHQLAKRYLGATTGVSGEAVIFDRQELRRSVGLYSDLYVLERRTGSVRALTRESRFQDPDLATDGRAVAAVRERAGRRDLIVVRWNGSMTRPALDPDERVLASAPDTQFSAPRWSPDGQRIAVERRRIGALPDVVVVDATTGDIVREISDVSARIVTPTWRHDGVAIVAAADFGENAFDLYEFPLAGGSGARRLTTTTGAFWPDVAPDGRTIVFVGYTADGSDLFEAPYPDASSQPERSLIPAALPLEVDQAPRDAPSSGRYTPARTLAPTTWTPVVTSNADRTRLGAAVGGSDVLGRHAYALSATWLVDGPTVVRPVDAAEPDWDVSYAYARWRPSYFTSASKETLFRTVSDGATSLVVPVAVVEQQVQGGVYLPLIHVRQNAQVLASLVRTDTRYRLAAGDRTNRVVSARFALAHDSTERPGYAISRERGISVGTTVELARRALGSRADATTTTVDMRAYLPGLGLHQVVALRAAGGASRGSELAKQAFSLGEFAASQSVIDFSSDALGLLRAGLDRTRTGDRIVVANAEYRLPLAILERGHGTWPLLLRTAHASAARSRPSWLSSASRAPCAHPA